MIQKSHSCGFFVYMPLTDADFQKAAEELGCETSAIRAVASVESAGKGFLPDGRPTLLFEAHIFSRLTQRKFDKSHPHISSPTWNRDLYRGGPAEWDRLDEARQLNYSAALMSASYGAFQIMGMNFPACGFADVAHFVESMSTEAGQLSAFIEFIKSNHLADELSRHDWAGFARIYNGPSYLANHYDVRMASAYKKFSEES